VILALVLYGTAVALIVTLGGIAVEPMVASLGLPRRGVWVGALLLSIAIPVVMVVRPHAQAPTAPEFTPTEQVSKLPSPRSSGKPTAPSTFSRGTPVVPGSVAGHHGPRFDRITGTAWLIISAGMLGAWSLSWIRILRQRSRWRHATADGLQVWVTPNLGPAVLGFFRPQILIPQWAMDGSDALRSIVLLHERAHIDARDPLLLLFGLLAVTAAPWNLPLWWQLRRLRFAIELDCDSRVLQKGTPMSAYGDVLLTVSQRGPRAPLGAMAIAKPRSELERRIRVMALPSVRPTRWLVGAAGSIAATCVAFAVGLPAPALRDVDLRHLPMHDWSPYLRMAETAARAEYPELFSGTFDGTVVMSVHFKRDGTVLNIDKRQFPSGPLADDARVTDLDVIDFLAEMDRNNDGTGGLKFLGWFGPEHANGLYLDYAVMKWPHDPTRSATRVRAAVASQYPEFFRSYPPEDAAQAQTGKLLTVFMNDDGTINRAKLDDIPDPRGFGERAFYDRLVALGFRPEQIGYRGRTFNTQDPDHLKHYPNAPNLVINFAWPRRPDDPPDIVFQSLPAFNDTFQKRSAENNDRVPDELFLKRYFPDLWERGPTSTPEAAWILVDVNGLVCDSGRTQEGGLIAVAKDLKDRYPGARIGLDIGVGADTATSRSVNLDYLRLEDDSPMTSCQSLANVKHPF